jgi:mRNA interferase MazF
VVTNRPYVPESGDVIWLDFDAEIGHEQSGRRPALVLSPSNYNERMGLLVCCPMTTQVKSFPFEVALEGARTSIVLADQIKSVDWRQRNARYKGKASEAEIAEVRSKIVALIGYRPTLHL